MSRLRKISEAIALTAFAVILVAFSEALSECVVSSINVCINVIIPSMFAFMVISSYILSSGMYRIIFKPLYIILKPILPLSEEIFSVFCLSLIGGYPVGVKLLKELIAENKNYSAIAEKTAVFSYCISPTFAVVMLGLGLYNSTEIGLIIYISCVVSNFIMAVIISHTENMMITAHISNKKSGLIQSINSSSSALFRICAVIVIFNVAITAADCVSEAAGVKLPVIMKAFFEISNILKAEIPTLHLLPLVTFLASTGGVCVLFQCSSIIQGGFSVKSFILSRIPTALIAGVVSLLIVKFGDISLPVSSVNRIYTFGVSTNNAAIVLLIAMCVILLQKSEKNFKKG